MQTRIADAPVPTEPMLGPWSLTAFAALLVIGGILILLSSDHQDSAVANGKSASHQTDRANPDR